MPQSFCRANAALQLICPQRQSSTLLGGDTDSRNIAVPSSGQSCCCFLQEDSTVNHIEVATAGVVGARAARLGTTKSIHSKRSPFVPRNARWCSVFVAKRNDSLSRGNYHCPSISESPALSHAAASLFADRGRLQRSPFAQGGLDQNCPQNAGY